MQVQVRARDNFSVFERDALVRAIEVRIIGYGEITSICARSMMVSRQGKEQTIGTLLLELPPWDTQRTTTEIGEDLCISIADIAGVLLGLTVTGRAIGIAMDGIGVIALAGIVVNNNIVLIDTYNDLKKAGQAYLEAALRLVHSVYGL